MTESKNVKLFNKDFSLLLTGQSISVIGDQLFLIVLMMITWESTKSELAMGMLMMCFGIPRFIIGFFAGGFSDRFSKKGIMIISDTIRALIMIVVAILAYFNSLDIPFLFVTVFLLALFEAFYHPAMTSSLPLIVPHQRLNSANSLSQIMNTFLAALAPSFGGVIYTLVKPFILIFIDGISFIISAFSKVFINLPKTHLERNNNHNYLTDMKTGFGVMKSNEGLYLFLIIAGVMNLFVAPLIALMAPFIELHLKIPPVDVSKYYGFIQGAISGGMTLGFIISSFYRLDGKKRASVMISCLYINTICCLFVGILQNVYATMLLYVILGTSMSIFNVGMVTLVQLTTPPEHLGKVLGILIGMTGGLLPIGFGLSGIIAKYLMDIPTLFIWSQSIVLLLVIYISFKKSFISFCSTKIFVKTVQNPVS